MSPDKHIEEDSELAKVKEIEADGAVQVRTGDNLITLGEKGYRIELFDFDGAELLREETWQDLLDNVPNEEAGQFLPDEEVDLRIYEYQHGVSVEPDRNLEDKRLFEADDDERLKGPVQIRLDDILLTLYQSGYEIAEFDYDETKTYRASDWTADEKRTETNKRETVIS